MTTPYQLNGTLVKDTDKYKNKKSIYVRTSHEKQTATTTDDDDDKHWSKCEYAREFRR